MMMPQGMGTGMMKWDGTPLPPDFAEKKMLAGILGILFGSFGVHKFILGYNTAGIIMLVVSLVSIPLWFIVIGMFGTMAMGIIGLIEGIIYLTMDDQQWANTYVYNKKGWF